PRHDRRWLGSQRTGFGRRPSGDRAHAGGKRCRQRQPRPSIFRHHGSLGGRQGASLAATGSRAACPRRTANAELRRLKTAPGLVPAPRRSALRKNRRLPRAEINGTTDYTDKTDGLKFLHFPRNEPQNLTEYTSERPEMTTQ